MLAIADSAGSTSARTGAMRAAWVGTTLACLLFAAPMQVPAQVAPTPTEIVGYTGMLAAAAGGRAGEIARLAAQGAPIDQRDSRGRQPLHVATFGRHLEAIRALASAGADLRAQEDDRYDAVTIAAVAGDVATLRTLLELGASAGEVTSRYDGTALIAAAHLGHAEVVSLLIAAGAPLDHVNNLGWTALLESILLGDGGTRHTDTLRRLVEAGADVNRADRAGRTPLQHARSRGYGAMVRILERAGAHN